MGLLDTTMEMAKLAGKIANPELVQEAMKANVEALELSRDNLELQKRIVLLVNQLHELQAQKDLRQHLFTNGGYLYLDGDPNPRCLTCWEHTEKLISVPPGNDYFGPQCRVCKNYLPHIPKTVPTRNDPGSVAV